MDQYKYISIAEAYRSIYAKPANHEDKRAATQYAETVSYTHLTLPTKA